MESVLSGVPAIVLDDRSIAHPVSVQIPLTANLSKSDLIKNPTDSCFDVRRHLWLADLSYMQWTLEEIESGDAWAHLNSVYEYQINH